MTFYDEWLETPARIQSEFQESATVAKDRDIPWVSTPQDAKVKLMIANQQGFATMGSNVLKAEIPVGWHTGKHRHGEEAIHILEGEGFSIIDGQRFDWHKNSTIQIPFWSEHQHFNDGDVPVLYLSAMSFDLERFVRLARIEQLETCGPNDPVQLSGFPSQESQYYADGSRAVIHLEDAPTDPSLEPQGAIAAVANQHHHLQYLAVPGNGFRATSVAITHLWSEPPYHHSGRHKHLEAVVYALEGDGYTDMHGEKVAWSAGDVLYVPPAMWEHEHTNNNPAPIKQLRIQFGIRFWFTDIWPEGFTSQRIYDSDGQPIEAGPIERDRERSFD
ncbi:cupin domain-containing protein [Actinophytocola sp.]|uniref:cupin domain-containing protein n=1 Tax=Actinophytocola sp. TaxID=1872138 RepID=UPI003D6AAAAC